MGGLLLLVLLTLSITLKAWREAKRSPYFFLRTEAAKRMQRYMLASLLLILVTIATTAYAWNSPEDTTVRVNRLSYAKPVRQAPETTNVQTQTGDTAPEAIEINFSSGGQEAAGPESIPGLSDPLLQPSTLPENFNTLESTTELSEDTAIGEISFSTDISTEYKAVDPGRRFTKGFFTLYATFDYAKMEDGMTWSWVWKRNGQVIDGGNQVWSYGGDGPGYVYLRPEEGFESGDYALEVWVNETLMAQSNFTIIDGISANN
jgi:hypothetical protein